METGAFCSATGRAAPPAPPSSSASGSSMAPRRPSTQARWGATDSPRCWRATPTGRVRRYRVWRDLRGNLWKISGTAGTPVITDLFQALDASNNPQPITAAPLVGKDPATGTLWVFFGTGSYISNTDLTSTQKQTWYGLEDTGTLISGRTDLIQRNITSTGTAGNFTVRVIDPGTPEELFDKKGWYIDLPSIGERMVVPNRFQGTALIGTTRIPDSHDVCSPGGKGFVMAINPFTGGALDRTFFDLNHDGQFNDADKLNGQIVSGIGFDSSPNNPIFVDNVMQVSLDNGTTKTVKTQGSSVEAKRMSWRELLN